MKLTETKIKNARSHEKPTRLSDGSGLYLYLSPSGGRLWRGKYRFEGKEKLISYGKYPDVSLADARNKHAAELKTLAQGTDSMAARKAVKATTRASFQKIAEDWHEHWREGKSEQHASSVLRRLKADVFPAIGHLAIAEIEAPSLVSLSISIQERGAYDIAKRALETIGQVFPYAIAHGVASRNPAADIKPRDILKTVHKRNYARIDWQGTP